MILLKSEFEMLRKIRTYVYGTQCTNYIRKDSYSMLFEHVTLQNFLVKTDADAAKTHMNVAYYTFRFRT